VVLAHGGPPCPPGRRAVHGESVLEFCAAREVVVPRHAIPSATTCHQPSTIRVILPGDRHVEVLRTVRA